MSESAQQARSSWERMPGEPNLWYGRFLAYLALGPVRSLDEAYRRSDTIGATGRRGTRAGQRWRDQADKWSWRERADAWDLDVRTRVEPKIRKAHERYLEVLQRNDERIEKALNQLDAMPLTRRRVTRERSEDGTAIIENITIEPLRSRASDIGRLARDQEQLTRQRAIVEARELGGGTGVDPAVDGLTGPRAPAAILDLPDNGRDAE